MEDRSGRVKCLDQKSYIKIEMLRGRTPIEIFLALKEVCGHEAFDRSTVSK